MDYAMLNGGETFRTWLSESGVYEYQEYREFRSERWLRTTQYRSPTTPGSDWTRLETEFCEGCQQEYECEEHCPCWN